MSMIYVLSRLLCIIGIIHKGVATLLFSNSGVTKPFHLRNSLVIKTHVCSETAIQRVSLARTNNAYDVYLLLFSFTNTSLHDDECQRLLRQYNIPRSFVLFANMLSLFPTLLTDAQHIPWAKEEPQQSLSSLPDCFVEPLFETYQYIWVFEYDVWWLGSLSEALQINDALSGNADFICVTGNEGTSFDFKWHARVEQKWDEKYMKSHNLHVSDMDGCLIPASRYSKRLLHHACDMTISSKAYFFSELWAPMLCKSLDGCIVSRLARETTTCHFNWAPPKGIAGHLCTSDMYEQNCKNMTTSQLVHPLKFRIK